MYYVLFYKTVENYIEKRTPFRAEHLRLAEAARQDGRLIMAGALDEPADAALLIFKCEKELVMQFAENDPYVKNGLIKEWTVRPWNVVVGVN